MSFPLRIIFFIKLFFRLWIALFKRNIILILLSILFSCQSLQSQVAGAGGITIKISPDIDISNLDSVSFDEKTLIVINSKIKKEISLPKGAIYQIIEMVSRSKGDYLVYSIDNFFYGEIQGSPYIRIKNTNSKINDAELAYYEMKEVTPFETLKKEFLYLFFHYDLMAHCLICQSEFKDPTDNPYVKRGGVSPRKKLQTYLNSTPSKSDTLTYWNLIKRYPNPPVCIGSINFMAEPSQSGYPFNILIKPSRFYVLRTWDMEFRVLQDKENRIADFPYMDLSKDIEANWKTYRKKYPMMDSLTSLVEAYVVVSLLKRDKLFLFQQLKTKSDQRTEPLQFSYPEESENVSTILEEKDWESLSQSSIGISINNPKEAELALSIEMNNWNQKRKLDISQKTLNELSTIAQTNANFNLQFLLFRAVNSQADSAYYLFSDFFKKVYLLKNSGKKFILWGQGIYWLQNSLSMFNSYDYRELKKLPYPKDTTITILKELLQQEKRKLIISFDAFTDDCINNNKTPNNQINEIVEVIYGIGLIDIAKSAFPTKEKGKYSHPEFIRLVKLISEIHYKAAMALDESKIETLHFHYRFISYLKGLTQSNEESIVAMQENILKKIAHDNK